MTPDEAALAYLAMNYVIILIIAGFCAILAWLIVKD